jgi:hypothetical protein
MYVNVKMIPVETAPGIRGEEYRRAVKVNSSMIYLIHCKNLCKYHNVSPTQHNNKGKKRN